MGVLKCDNVVKLYEVFKTSTKFYLAFEFCSGGDLAGYIKKKGALPSKKVRKFMQDIAAGLKYLRKKNVFH
jgi:serine/threonine-protein kinase ULK2